MELARWVQAERQPTTLSGKWRADETFNGVVEAAPGPLYWPPTLFGAMCTEAARGRDSDTFNLLNMSLISTRRSACPSHVLFELYFSATALSRRKRPFLAY